MLTLGNAMANLQAWASKSLLLAKSGNEPAAPPAAQNSQDLAANLPTMPTGAGQINLIDSEFPAEGNRAARRAALDRIPLLFPADKVAIVDAVLDLAYMDLDDEKWADALARIAPAVNANRSALSAEKISWADYLAARALTGLKRIAEATAIYQKIADDATLSANRRAWAIYRLAQILADSAPIAALDLADKGLPLESAVIPTLYGWYATTAIKNNAGDRLKDRVRQLISAKPQNLEDVLLAMVDSAQGLIDSDQPKQGLDLVTLLESVADPATTGDAFARAVKKAHEDASASSAFIKLQLSVRLELIQLPAIAGLEQKQPKFSSRADAEKSMTQHEDNSEPDQALGCALRLLTRYAPDRNFPESFWQCFTITEWASRASPSPATDSFLFKLADLADALPHDDDAYCNVKVLLAKVLERKNRRTEAAAIYDALAQQPGLPDGFRGPVALRRGNIWAELGDYAKAQASYHSVESLLDVQPSAQESVLREAFLALNDGDKTEALRLLNLLAQSAKRGKIKPGEQITDFISVSSGSAEIPAFWDNWQAWWPQWEKLAQAADLPALNDQKIVPVIASWAGIGADLQKARAAKDNKTFFSLLRQIAQAARYYPEAVEKFVGVLPGAEALLPEHANDFRALALAMLEPLPAATPADQQRRVLNLLVNFVDSGQYGKALDLMAGEWKEDPAPASIVTQAIHRVWALAAENQHRDLDTVAAILLKDLQLPDSTDRRLTVVRLANVYGALGRQTDAAHLLEAELASPKLAADTDGQNEIKSLLENFRNVAEKSQQLADGVALWLRDHQPPWWDFAEPKSAADPRLARLDEILTNSNGEFQPAELIKAGLLAPSVPTLNSDTQQDAVLRAFESLSRSLSTQDQADAFARSVLDNPSLPASLKTDFLYHVLWMATSSRQVRSYDTFRALPLYDKLTANSKDILTRKAEFMKVDYASATALSSYVQSLARQPLNAVDLDNISEAVYCLLRLGDLDGASAIYQAAANYSFGSNARTTKPQFQLTLLRQINGVKQVTPTLDAFRKVALAAQGDTPAPEPPSFSQRLDWERFDDLSEADATRFRRYLIQRHLAPLSLPFWFDFMSDLPRDAQRNGLIVQLLKAGLENSDQDDVKATVIIYALGLLDFDNPSERQQLLDLLQPYRDSAKFPQTMENIRIVDVTLALRGGQTADLEARLGGFTSRSNIFRAIEYKIRAYLQARDLPHLKSVLNGLSADQMTSPSLVRHVLPGLEAAGLNDEADLARDTLQRQFYRHVLTAWYEPLGENLNVVTEDLFGLGSSTGIPAAFVDFAASQVARRQSLLGFRLEKAFLEKDWTNAAAFGAAYTEAFPNFYSQYWPLGRSLAELGKNDEAIKALTVYCQYSLDEVTYPEAKALLDKLKHSQK